MLGVARRVLRGVEPFDCLERVDSHQNGPSPGVNLAPLVAETQVVRDGGFVEEGERADVFRVRFGGVGRKQVANFDAPRRVFVAQLDQTVARAVFRGIL